MFNDCYLYTLINYLTKLYDNNYDNMIKSN